MRVAVVVALVVGGCARDEDFDPCPFQGPDRLQCDSGGETEHVVHWAFKSQSTGMQSSCLPGNPNVEVMLGAAGTFDCALGQATMQHSPTDTSVFISSGGYKLWTGFTPGFRDLATIVIPTDGGYVDGHWQFEDAQGMPATCDGSAVVAVRFLVDDTLLWQSAIDCHQSGALAGPIAAGSHTLRAETVGSVVVTSSAVDITVENDVALIVDPLTLRLP